MKKIFISVFMLATLVMGCVDDSTDPGNTSDAGTPGIKRIFITSKGSNGSLGGLKGADSLCASAALDSGLGGKWVAWLSSSTEDAIDRVKDVGPWYLVDGTTLIFKNKSSMISSNPEAPISQDEYGQPIGPVYYWTGTAKDGKKDGSPQYCMIGGEEWTNGTSPVRVSVGLSEATSDSWWSTYFATYGCGDTNFRLLCIEQ